MAGLTLALRCASRWWLRPAMGGVVFVTWLAGTVRPSRRDIYIDRLMVVTGWLIERGLKTEVM